MITDAVFLAIIFVANVIQGITGFAGTLLAMPFSMFLVSIGTAKAVMNLLGVSSGLQICLASWNDVNKNELRRILTVMGPGVLAGFVAVGCLRQYENIQLLVLGAFIFGVGVMNLAKARLKWTMRGGEVSLNIILFLAGLFHGMFVCGGALLVVYLSRKTPEKNEFRSTISAVWLILNSAMLVNHIYNGYFDAHAIALAAIAVPLVLVSVALGGTLLKKMSQAFFVRLTNILLIVSGLSLFLK